MTSSHDSALRQLQLKRWLDSLAPSLGLQAQHMTPVSGDASLRHYFRIPYNYGNLLVMDAPPPEDSQQFIRVAGLLARAGVVVPKVLAQDLQLGFLLIGDLGRHSFYQALVARQLDAQQLQQHYRAALRTLVRIQQATVRALPVYDRSTMLLELQVFTHWYLYVHLGYQLDQQQSGALKAMFEHLCSQIDAQPKVLVHRDFHSPNLILGTSASNYAPGVIDFQDAVYGPISYDIASLALDARFTWDESWQLDWAIRYWEYARAAGLSVDPDFASFHSAYELTSLQRNLRILGVFARLWHRDGKDAYLQHMPRVLAYVHQVAQRYGYCKPLLQVLQQAHQQQPQDGFSF